jgi:hypothetical protein
MEGATAIVGGYPGQAAKALGRAERICARVWRLGDERAGTAAPQDSALPGKLMALGYAVRNCGTGTRLTPGGTVETIGTRSAPITRHHAGFTPIEILEISLPGA